MQWRKTSAESATEAEAEAEALTGKHAARPLKAQTWSWRSSLTVAEGNRGLSPRWLLHREAL